MQSGGRPRDNYDPLDRTFYYLRLKSRTIGLLQSLSNTKVLLFHSLLDRNVNRHPYSIEAYPSDQLFACVNAANIGTSCSALGLLVTVVARLTLVPR